MNQAHLHQLFQELSANLVCPICKKRIPAQCLHVQETKGNMCLFEAMCDNCNNALGISAVIEAHVTDQGKKFNNSSLISEQQQLESPILSIELDSIKNKLNNFSSFQSLFN